jgi:type IV secretory pathway TrbD component
MRTLHQSLTRPILLAGAAPAFLAFEVMAGGALYVSIGPRLPALVALGLLVTVVHPVAVWLTSLDPLCLPVYLRSLTQDFYPARPELEARLRSVPPSIPHVR